MFYQFCKYFFRYIFYIKTRQKLLFLAIVGLFISSFSLLVLQSTMGGLQHKLVTRSKNVLGNATIFLDDGNENFTRELMDYLSSVNIKATPEYEIELLLRHKNYISPVIVHAIDNRTKLIKSLEGVDLEDLVLPADLATKLNLSLGSQVRLISPSHVDSLMGDIPRMATLYVDDVISTNVPEVDSFHVWTRLAIVQNLIRSKKINRIRMYSQYNYFNLKKVLKGRYGNKLVIRTWEEENSTLVWALRLETIVMVFLFIAMTMLVSLCITSGLMIFFDKVKIDLASFWIIGASKSKLEKSSAIFLNAMSLLTVFLGLFCGTIFLLLLDKYGIEIMPDIFIDRKIPIYITTRGVLISFIVPYGISILFSWFSLNQFKKDSSYLDHVRTIG